MTDVARMSAEAQREVAQRYERIRRELVDEGLLAAEGEVLRLGDTGWPMLEPAGEGETQSAGTDLTAFSPALPPLELARFEDQVLTVLRQVSQANRDDPGHARSVQFRHVMERQLLTAVDLLEEKTQ